MRGDERRGDEMSGGTTGQGRCSFLPSTECLWSGCISTILPQTPKNANQRVAEVPRATTGKLTLSPTEVKDTQSGSEWVLRLSRERFSLV